MATARIQTQAPAGGGSADLLPDGEYILTIDDAKIEEDQYAKPEKDGTQPQKLVVTWLLEDENITPRQRKKGVKAGKKMWSRYGLFYYTKADGTDTAMKALFDALAGAENAEGIAFEFDPDNFDPLDLIGIRARCMVEIYKKKMGANAGQEANRVLKVLRLDDEDEDDSPPAPPARPAPAPRRNKPVELDNEVPF